MRYIALFVFILTHSIFLAQISEDFSDGDFVNNPTWAGTAADYTVNTSSQLQLNNSVASSSYLSTPHGLLTLDAKEWKLWTRQSFSPSSSNFGRIYLTATNSDLSTDPDGFYLQLGEAGSTDAVRLFKCQAGVHTELLAGTTGQIANSFSIGIRVVRDNAGNWSLYVDPNGGENFILVGTTNDVSTLLGTHFGVVSVYTLSNSAGFYYDNIYVGDEILDLDPPALVAATAINANQIDVLFDEALDPASAGNVNNYTVQPGLSLLSATPDALNPALVHLTPATAMTNGTLYSLTSENIQDLSGNNSALDTTTFGYYIAETALPGDVIINEFMCDPTPGVGLPEVEFVEIFNRSNKVFDLSDWKLSDASSSGTIQQDWLLPGEYRVLTPTSSVDSFVYATAVTSFPSLNNAGDDIVLSDANGVVLDKIAYTDAWYKDPSKTSGGYTIERINPNDPCTDIHDWSASSASNGGTPGQENAVYNPTPDVTAPEIDQLIALAPNYLEIYFNEGMDSASLMNMGVTVNPTLTVQNIYVLAPFPTLATIEFTENLLPSQTYSIELQTIADCWQNSVNRTGVFALPEVPGPGEVIINEILFNPVTGGEDWVEVYNPSDKLFDLYQWEWATVSNDTISSNKSIQEHVLLYPGEYLVFGKDTLQILQHYPTNAPGRFVQMDLPTYSNDAGAVYLIAQNTVIDQVIYSEDWHFQLLDDPDGKSLERIDPDRASNESDNWHTAAEAIGFGTPGLENSQFRPVVSSGTFSYSSETISPDNDGFEDVLQISYELEQPGFVGDFTIYDDRGRKVATVLKSELLGTSGVFTWDGVDDNQNKASIGVYVGVFEVFDPNGGTVYAKRKAFTVAGML